MENTMYKIYHDPAHPAGLASLNKLRIATAEAIGVKPSLSQVKHYLERDDTYTLHKPARIHFPRNRVLVNGIDKQFQADLVDMSEYMTDNDNVRYLLTCIDVFSKYAWVRCLTTKTGPAVAAAFEDILAEGRIPMKLQTDEGKEFYNTTFKQLMKRCNIKHFSTASEVKSSIVERFNRSFKGRMWKYLTSVNSRRYVHVIPELTQAYNNAYHRSIHMAPAEVNKDNEKLVFNTLYKTTPQRKVCFKFNVGDTVRISKLRGVFRKGYEQTYTDEIFTVKERIGRQPPVYRLADLAGEVLKGTFYEPEIQRVIVDKNKTFKIESILARKKVGRKKMALVKWLGWPTSFNSWIPEKDIIEV
uniref:Integrase catalytic domain-containing protein n=1 Tax=Oreochromis niloticus TaxID=8128 RepID=A0A669DYD4_ORENI